MKPAILLLDDDEDVRFGIGDYLSHKGFRVDGAGTLGDARAALSSRPYDVLLVDLKLPDGDGQDLIGEVREASPDMGIIVISGRHDVPSVVEAMRRGSDNFLTKPISMADLDMFLRKALEAKALRRRERVHERLARKDGPFFGETPAITGVLSLASLAAKNDAAILIRGETGTGKGVLARWLHDSGPRHSMPFVDVNCSSLKGDMLASELFGHVKGAFTSAVNCRQGLIDLADGGTLFLDEIGDMDAGVQAQFLKVIEDKHYRRMGEARVRTSDFRLLCATSRDLQAEVQRGTFREDLLFRINVFPIVLPPLRDMLEDIPGLARHILSLFGFPGIEMPADVTRLFETYPWPGNIRELRNVLERALILANGKPLTPEHFLWLHHAAQPPSPDLETWNLRQLVHGRIAQALDHHGGNKRKAAKALGITPRTLYRWLSKREEDGVDTVLLSGP